MRQSPANSEMDTQVTELYSPPPQHPTTIDCNDGVVNLSMPTDSYSVLIRNAVKTFGYGKHRSDVLIGLNMTVKKGSIYGLLGASGCGKTTLLSCIVGRRNLDSGDIMVLDGRPGSPQNGVPGPRVGYMPQELALYGEFTIMETLEYFGRIYNLSPAYVKSQKNFLCKLLDLPSSNRFVKTLSGGQQRRVSFAVALFHEPELLILDEPTVGVDPLLRHSIWNHLVSQSVDHGRTVIITTHYIEEARRANKIGMMRIGRLLAEEEPENLLRNYGLSSLEDVFLSLCVKDGTKKHIKAITSAPGSDVSTENAFRGAHSQGGQDNLAMDHSVSQVFDVSGTSNGHGRSQDVASGQQHWTRDLVMAMPSWHRTSALTHKHCLQIVRNIGMFVFIFIMPILQTVFFNLAIGRDPTSLKMAVVNDEINMNPGSSCGYNTATDCFISKLSCRYLQFLNNETIVQVPYKTLPDAMKAADNGYVWGVIHFGQNFTEELSARQNESNEVTNDTIIGSRIGINMDFSNQQISAILQRRLIDAYNEFTKDILKACSFESAAGSLPVTFLKPVYGNENSPYTDFMAPAVILTMVYFSAVTLTTGVFITEKKEGLLDRSLVAGVQLTEFLLAILATQIIVMIMQTFLIFVLMLFVFNVPCNGSIAVAILVTILQGLCGMCFGLLVSTLCDDESSAIYLTLGSFYPTILLCGLVWPIEGMWYYLRYISYFLPQTYAIESLRSIFARGWGVELPDVYWGFVITIGWTIALFAACVIVVRVRKTTG